eukprot:4132233-Alexandrium_andersonii.AAC.1
MVREPAASGCEPSTSALETAECPRPRALKHPNPRRPARWASGCGRVHAGELPDASPNTFVCT